jgi:hypothetical protein
MESLQFETKKEYAHNVGLPKMPQERLLVTWQGVRVRHFGKP